jgi:hypothetical protein
MAVNRRTINFLPQVFQTDTNKKFLGSTLDQLISEPDLKKINGFIGRKLSPSLRGNDNYIVETNSDRQNYQLEPTIVARDSNQDVEFVATYSDIINKISFYGGITNDHSRLFESEYYNFDPHIDLDKFVNYSQYHWVPEGPEVVTISSRAPIQGNTITFTRSGNNYLTNQTGSVANPTIYIVRGQSYTFTISHTPTQGNLWIQSEPGRSGVKQYAVGISSRSVLGISNNGINTGNVSITIPDRTSQDQYLDLDLFEAVDYALSGSFTAVDGATWTSSLNIGGQTFFADNRYVIFTTSSTSAADWTNRSSTVVDSTQRRGIWRTNLVQLPGDAAPKIHLTFVKSIPANSRVAVKSGSREGFEYFVNSTGLFEQIPDLTAPLDILYYQNSLNESCRGEIRILDHGRILDIDRDIVGNESYITPQGQVLRDGMLLYFDDTVFPEQYRQRYFYVEGVGQRIVLVPQDQLPAIETISVDYITINRSSIDRNPWSRCNRWFHADLLGHLSEQRLIETRAKRPIIEFEPNLQLYNYGRVNLAIVDYLFDENTYINVNGVQTVFTNASTVINNATYESLENTFTFPLKQGQLCIFANDVSNTVKQRVYRLDYVDQSGSSSFNGTIAGEATGVQGSYKIISGNADNTTSFAIELGIGYDLFTKTNVYLGRVSDINGNYELTLDRPLTVNLVKADGIKFIKPRALLTVLHTAEYYHSVSVRSGLNQGESFYWYQKIYSDPASTVSAPIITLVDHWRRAQTKNQTNQEPLFDIILDNTAQFTGTNLQVKNISLGHELFFEKNVSFTNANQTFRDSKFAGTPLFSYTRGNTPIDPYLNFNLEYISSADFIGDINFTNNYNSDMFEYRGLDSNRNISLVSGKIDVGYIRRNRGLDDNEFDKFTMWSSVGITERNRFIADTTKQYQHISAVYDGITSYFNIDTEPAQEHSEAESEPNIKVFVNNRFVPRLRLGMSPAYQFERVGVANAVKIDQRILSFNDNIDILVYSKKAGRKGYYQIPTNLEFNPNNSEIGSMSMGQLRNHLNVIGQNIKGLIGDINGNSNITNFDYARRPGTILQHSSLFALAPLFLVGQQANFIDALDAARRDYTRFKHKFLELSGTLNGISSDNIVDSVDRIIDAINSSKNPLNFPYYYSDMLPVGSKYVTKTFTIKSTISRSFIADRDLSTVRGLLVYLNGVQLTKVFDYNISGFTIELTNSVTIAVNDKLILREYANTDGCYVPETPTKLGLYPKFQPLKFLDNTYRDDIYVIQGHDGSLTPAFNDFRDDLLLEFERRIYNNIKIDYNPENFDIWSNIPGKFRNTDYSLTEFNRVLNTEFLRWAGNNHLDYTLNDTYLANDQFSYNYNRASDIDGQSVPGYWRGIYKYYFDTDRPHSHPWEMFGYTLKPTWWDNTYSWTDTAKRSLLISAVRSGQPSPVIANGLQLYYDWGNTDCYSQGNTFLNLVDSTRNNGYLKNNIKYSSEHGGIMRTGGYNSGISNSVGDRIDIETYAGGTDRFGNGDFTIGFWVKKLEGPAGSKLLSTGSAGALSGNDDKCIWQFYISDQGFYWWNSSGGSTNNIQALGSFVETGVWQFVTVTYQYNNSGNNTVRCYINGKQKLTATVSTGTHDYVDRTAENSLQYTLGGGYSSSCMTTNTKAEFGPFMLYNRTLTAEEVDFNYRASSSRFEFGVNTRRSDLYRRPRFSEIVPVGTDGNLIPPMGLIVQNFNTQTFSRSFSVGDHGPVESAWRRTSDYVFALQKAMALLKPAQYFGRLFDISSYGPQSIGGDRQFANFASHKRHNINQISVLGTPTDTDVARPIGYINWVYSYLIGLGIDPVTKLTGLLQNTDVNLVHKLGGFTDKQYIQVLAEQFSPGSVSESVIIPDENYQIQLNKSVPVDRAVYSAVIVEKSNQGWTVTGYNLRNPFFTIIPSETSGTYYNISVLDTAATIYQQFRSEKIIIPYGFEFTSRQQVVDFLVSYQRFLVAQGFVFDNYDNTLAVVRDWILSAKEFLTWSLQGWGPGNVLVLSPVVDKLNIVSTDAVVDSLVNSVYDSQLMGPNFNVLKKNDFSVLRDNSRTSIYTISGQTVAFADLSLVQYEHVMIFDNVTVFNDILYKPELGNRQYRLKLVGSKTDNWDGQLTPPGFLHVDSRYQAWQPNQEYRKGDSVEYRNRVYVAMQNISPDVNFNFNSWKESDTIVESGLVPNFALLASRLTEFYNVDSETLDENLARFSSGLIGYRTRTYLSELGLDETSQLKFYQGMIKHKGTLNAMEALIKGDFDDISSSIQLYEEWGARLGEYGAIDANPELTMMIRESVFNRNPTSFEFLNYNQTPDSSSIPAVYPNQLLNMSADFDPHLFLNRNSQNHKLVEDLDLRIKTRLAKIELFGDNLICGTQPSELVAYSISVVENLGYDIDVLGSTTYGVQLLDDNGLIFDSRSVGDAITIAAKSTLSVEDLEYVIESPTELDRQLQADNEIDFTVSSAYPGQPLTISVRSKQLIEKLEYSIESPTQEDVFADRVVDIRVLDRVRAGQEIGFSVMSIKTTETLYWSIETPNEGESYTFTYLESPDGCKVKEDGNIDRVGQRVDEPVDYLLYSALTDDSLISVTTRSVGGSTSSELFAGTDGANGPWPDDIDADIVIINHGLNDAKQRIEVDYYKNTLENIRANLNRKTAIIWVLPPPVNMSLPTENGLIDPRTNWNKTGVLEQYRNAMREVAVLGGDYVVDPAEIPNWQDYLDVDPMIPNQHGYRALVRELLAPAVRTAIRDRNQGNQESYENDVITAGYVKNDEVHKQIFDISKYSFTSIDLSKFETGYKIWLAKDFNHEWQVYRLLQNEFVVQSMQPDLDNKITVNLWKGPPLDTTVTGTRDGFTADDVAAIVNSWYLKYAYRNGEQGGLDYWVGEYINRGIELNDLEVIFRNIVYQFINSGQELSQQYHGIVEGDIIAIRGVADGLDGVYRVLYSDNSTVTIQGTQEQNNFLNNSDTYGLNSTIFDFQPMRFDDMNHLRKTKPKRAWMADDLLYVDDAGLGTWRVYSPEIETYANTTQTVTNVRYENTYSIRIENCDAGPMPTTVAGIRDGVTADDVASIVNTFYQKYLLRNATQVELDRFVSRVFTDLTKELNQHIENIENEIRISDEAQQLVSSGMLIPQIDTGESINFTILSSEDTEDLYWTIEAIEDETSVRPDNTSGNIAEVFLDTVAVINPVYKFNRVRDYELQVDVDSIGNAYIYNNKTKHILARLDIYDPVKGRLLGASQQDLDYTTSIDPAQYNAASAVNPSPYDPYYGWREDYVGTYWWNLDNCRFGFYEQGSLAYREQHWGELFPGSKVEVYEWIETDVLPSIYVQQGRDGVPLYPDDSNYTSVVRVDPASNGFTTRYFYWVRAKTEKTNPAKRLSVAAIEKFIENPFSQNIPFMVALKDNAVSLFNVGPYVQGDDSVLYISSKRTLTENIIHTDFGIIQEGNPDTPIPERLEQKIIDSICGIDSEGNLVPDAALPYTRRYGIENYPRQSVIVDRIEARENVIKYINSVLIKHPVADRLTDLPNDYLDNFYAVDRPAANSYTDQTTSFADLAAIVAGPGKRVLVNYDETMGDHWSIYEISIIATNRTSYIFDYADFQKSYAFILPIQVTTNPATYTYYGFTLVKRQGFDTRRYWSFVDWYAEGFSSRTKPNYIVPNITEVHKLDLQHGDIVKVYQLSVYSEVAAAYNGDFESTGDFEIYQYQSVDGILRPKLIGLSNGTIQIGKEFYRNWGFDTERFDSLGFDYNLDYELRWIMKGLKEDLLVNDLEVEYNKIMYYIIDYILTEQKYIDWFFKTSFISVKQSIEGFKQQPGFIKDRQKNIEEYIAEVKPYRTKLRQFILNYSEVDVYSTNITDFDVPAYWDTRLQTFRPPNGDMVYDQQLLMSGQYQDWLRNYHYRIEQVDIYSTGYGYRGSTETTLVAPEIIFNRLDSAIGEDAKAEVTLDPRTFGIDNLVLTQRGNRYLMAPEVQVIGNGGTIASDTRTFDYVVTSIGLSDTSASGKTYNTFTLRNTTENTVLWSSPARSYTMHRIRRVDGRHVFTSQYDVFGSIDEAKRLAVDLDNTTSDYIVVVHTYDEPQTNRFYGGLAESMYRCGASRAVFGSSNFRYRSAYVLVGIPESGEGNGIENYAGLTNNSTTAYASVRFALRGGYLVPLEADPRLYSIGTAISFPTNPAPNQTYTMGNKSWIWNGTGWNVTRRPVGFLDGDVAPRRAQLIARLENYTTRKIKTTIRFDRVWYTSSVVNWVANVAYNPGTLLSYNGRGYLVVSKMPANSKFQFGYVQELNSGTFNNANDRIMAYYVPDTETNLGISKDLEQLVPGIGGAPAYDFSSDVGLDTILIGDTFGSTEGLNAGNIILSGGRFVDALFSHAPEELVPGRTYETVDIRVVTSNSTDTGFRYFKNMNDVVTGTAFTPSTVTTLALPLLVTDTNITVTNGSILTIPNPGAVLPGIVYINGERISYYTKVGNVLGQIRRGIDGTGIAQTHPSGSRVEDVSQARASTLYLTDYTIPVPPVVPTPAAITEPPIPVPIPTPVPVPVPTPIPTPVPVPVPTPTPIPPLVVPTFTPGTCQDGYKLVSNTYTTSTTITIPLGVTALTLVGKGSDGTQINPQWESSWTTGLPGFGPVFARIEPTAPSFITSLDIENSATTYYNSIPSLRINDGGLSWLTKVYVAGRLYEFYYAARVRLKIGGVKAKLGNGWGSTFATPISEPKLYAIDGTQYEEYRGGTNGVAAGFDNTVIFYGGQNGNPAPFMRTTVQVTPQATYSLSIPPGGSIRVEYCEPVSLPVVSVQPNGDAVFTTPGAFTWTCPDDVTKISVLAVGGGGGGGYAAEGQGGGGGGGGGLGWINNYTVVPGTTYTVVVGNGGSAGYNVDGGNGGDSYFISTATVAGFGGRGGVKSINLTAGAGQGGLFAGQGGGAGGNGGQEVLGYGTGGGGAGGYAGAGGAGGNFGKAGSDGFGGGGGGGAGEYSAAGPSAGGGGGVGLYGQDINGAGGKYNPNPTERRGLGGSNGQNASIGEGKLSQGGLYGGGGSGGSAATIKMGGEGGSGAVRILWGPSRKFPGTDVNTSEGTSS